MLARPSLLLGALTLGLGLVAASCAKSTKDGFDPNAQAPDGGAFAQEAGSKPDPSGAGEVFGHSENTLYRVDTVTREVSEIGTFQGCTYVADIALDEGSNISASTGSELYLVETNTARCTLIASGTFPNSLSFVPAGTVESDREALVGFQGGDYVKIDTTTGKVTKVGQIGDGLQSSGDVVSAKGGRRSLRVHQRRAASAHHAGYRQARCDGHPDHECTPQVLGRRLDDERPGRPRSLVSDRVPGRAFAAAR